MRLENISWVKAEAYFKENDTVILPVGSLECHGKHLPLGTDTLIPNKILSLLEPLTDTLIAPTLPYGSCDYLSPFAGTVSLGHDVLYAVIGRICEELYNHGARHFIVLNGHGGNVPILDRVALDLYKKGALLAQVNWWLLAGELNPAWKGGHGGAEETAGVLAVDPSLVDWDMVEDLKLKPFMDGAETVDFKNVVYKGGHIPIVRPIPLVTDNGWFGTDHPSLATPEWGNDMVAAMADYIAAFAADFKAVPLPQSK